MTCSKILLAAVGLLGVFLASGEARADVSEPSSGFVLIPAAPGIVTATASLTTTIGSAITQADGDPSTGWSIASIVTGSLGLTSGAVYTGVVADHNAEPELFATIAAGNFALGASSLVLGIVGLTTGAEPESMGYVPRFTVDGEGRRFVVVTGEL